MLTLDIRRFIGEEKLGFVATVCPDGTPNLSPKGTVRALDDHHLAFADIRSPGTIANLRSNPAVEINVVDQFIRKGWRFKGTAVILEAGPEFERILETFFRQTAQEVRRIRAIVVVKVERVLPLISPVYDRETTEHEVRAKWWAHWKSIHFPDSTT
jgi:uncharacterized protein